MSYITSGSIEATDYNAFATLANSMNEIFADLHPGATTIANRADYGYGQTPALASVAAGDPVTSAQWSALFNTMKSCGTHQGTTTVPPLPATNPAAGESIVSYNTNLAPTAVNTLLSTLSTNRHNLALLQSTTLPGVGYASVNTWTTQLTYSFGVDFASWNNARYFFNSGGFLGINGSYPSASSPIEIEWRNLLINMSPLKFTWNATTPATGTNEVPGLGFYDLTTTYQEIYKRSAGGGYYSSSYISVEAKLANVAGTNGRVEFRISLIDADPTPDVKSGAITFTCDNTRSTGVITYPGPAVAITSYGFVYA